MFVVAQFPLLDVRRFVPQGRLGPPWPHVQQGDFLRSFGHVEQRRRGPVEEWPADGHYCRARNALKFPDRFGAVEKSSSTATVWPPNESGTPTPD